MEKDLISMGRRERDVLKMMSGVLKVDRTQVEAARLLGRSARQIRRLAGRLRKEGDGAVVHGLRSKPSNHRVDEAVRARAAILELLPPDQPVIVALYRTKELSKQEGHQHRTAIEPARPLMGQLMRWFPQRRFILLGDGGYASHALTAFCHRHRRQLTLISLLHPRAHLCTAPPKPRKSVSTWASRRRGTARTKASCVPRRACWGCSAW